jgi:hypothetical protein
VRPVVLGNVHLRHSSSNLFWVCECLPGGACHDLGFGGLVEVNVEVSGVSTLLSPVLPLGFIL